LELQKSLGTDFFNHLQFNAPMLHLQWCSRYNSVEGSGFHGQRQSVEREAKL